MRNEDKKILALRTAYIAGIFSIIISSIMLLNYWQLVSSDPLESEALKSLVERLQEDTSNEELKHEIRNLDLMARNAYFTNRWQIRSGSYLLVAGIVITVIALRVYYASKAEIIKPDEHEASLDIELFISRQWIIYTVMLVFGLALIASFLTINHLSVYRTSDSLNQEESVPTTQIIPNPDEAVTTASIPETDTTETEVIINRDETSDQPVTDPVLVESDKKDMAVVTAETGESDLLAPPTIDEIIKNYPSFRGPFGLGISYHKDIPTDWDGASGNRILWKAPISLPGYSSPVYWDQLLFLTGADEENESIYCFDAHTGQLLWEHKVTGIPRPTGTIKPTEDTGFAAPTATTDGRYVFAIYATGDLICLDMDGNKIWSKNIGIPDNHYGHSSSLLVWKDFLLIQFDTNQEGKVFAADVHSGEQLWETLRSSTISWASPILINVGDHHELILASSPDISAYDPEDGKKLWSVDCLSGEIGPSPAYDNGILFSANEYAKLTALEPGDPPKLLWESNEYLPEVSSPVATQGLLFISTSYGVIVCYDGKSGDILWEYECDRGFYASPIIVDGKIYFLDRSGKMYIFSVSRTMELINDPELGAGTVSTPAFSEGRIYIRGNDHLYCIGS